MSIDISIKNFINDVYASAFRERDVFYSLSSNFYDSLNTKEREIMVEAYRSRVNYIRNNVSLQIPPVISEDDDSLPHVKYHPKFGWVLSKGGATAFLGKFNLTEVPSIAVGHMTYFSSSWVLRSTGRLVVGCFCCIAENFDVSVGMENHPTEFMANLHWSRNERLKFINESFNFDACRGDSSLSVEIGNDVWIGRNVRVQPGTKIPNGVVIGEGSFVRGVLEPYGVYVGNPARLIKYRFPENVISKIERLEWWHWDFDHIRREFHLFNTPMHTNAD